MAVQEQRHHNQIIVEPETADDPHIRLAQYRATLRLAGMEIEQRNRVIRGLTSFTYQASRVTEPGALLKLALTQVLMTTNAEVGAIVLIDSQTNALSVGVQRGLKRKLVQILAGREFAASATVLMPYLVSGKGALLELGPNASDAERDLLATGDLNSLTSLPLKVGDSLLGALVVGTQAERRLTAADVHYLLAIAQGTAVALDALNLRDRLWQMAEMMLGSGALFSEDEPLPAEPAAADTTPLLSGLQAKLAGLVTDLGGAVGAVFTLRPQADDGQVTLAADYGLSPGFTGLFAKFHLSDALFPFERLNHRHLLVKHLKVAIAYHDIPLLRRLQEEGVQSLIAAQIAAPGEPLRVIMVGAADISGLIQRDIQKVLAAAPDLLAQLTDVVDVPTLPTHSIHVPSLEREASEDDLEQLLAAMMLAEEEVERHNRDWIALNGITKLLNQSLFLDSTLDEVIEKTAEFMDTDAVWLYLVDPAQPRRLFLQAYCSLSPRYVQTMHRISLGDGLEGDVAAQNEAQFLPDVAADARRCQMLLELGEIQAAAAVPLACPDLDNRMRVVGVLAAGNRQPAPWSPRQVRLLNSIATQLAFSVNNAQLYARVRQDVQALEESNEMLARLNEQLLLLKSQE